MGTKLRKGPQLTERQRKRGCLLELMQGSSAMAKHIIPMPSPHRFSRLQHILGGKSRRIIEGDAECALESQSENHDDPDVVDGSVPKNLTDRVIVDSSANEDLGLEIAMKQLMEATHDALVNMKGEILTMQCDLERALSEINLLQQQQELLQNQIEDKSIELEKKFCWQIHELQETVIVELKICKEQMEQRMLQKLKLLLKEKKTEQNNERSRTSRNQHSNSKRSSAVGGGIGDQCAGLNHYQHKGISVNALEDRSTLTEAMLQRISPKRLERSAAVVRGWLQSSTPSESSSIAPSENVKSCNLKRRLSNLPMCNLVSSVKAEAKLYATHRRASFLARSKSCDPSSETQEIDFLTAPNTMPIGNASDMHVEIVAKIAPNSCDEKICQSPVSVLDATVDASDEVTEFLIKPYVYDQNSIAFWSEKAAFPPDHQHEEITARESQIDGKKMSSPASEKPILRILKPESFKISDLLLSDSEEDVS